MAIYFRGAEAVPLNGKQAHVANGIHNSGAAAETLETLTGDAGSRAGQKLLWTPLHPAKRGIKDYSLPLVFFAGLVVGCVASNASKKERDVYSELAPSLEVAYKMKTTLLKANLLLQGMDTVIENANKNSYIEEGK